MGIKKERQSMKPNFKLWESVLCEYVSPNKSVEFRAQLARLFTAFSAPVIDEAEPERKVQHETPDEVQRRRETIAEIQAGWTDAQRKARREGVRDISELIKPPAHPDVIGYRE